MRVTKMNTSCCNINSKSTEHKVVRKCGFWNCKLVKTDINKDCLCINCKGYHCDTCKHFLEITQKCLGTTNQLLTCAKCQQVR